MRVSILFSYLALVFSSVSAWSINGHIFVANIAQNLLLENSPDSLNYALDLLKTLEEYNATLTSHELDHPFVEAATFADDIKYHGGAWQSDFHFIDNVWIKDGVESDYDISVNKHNLTNGMKNIVQWLSLRDDGNDYLDSYMYNYIQFNLYPGRTDLAQSYALRLLLHYIGDIHQPFHAEAQYSSDYPTGDAGANLFDLPSHYSVDELHAVWDYLVYSQHVNIARPINDTYWPVFSANTLLMAQAGASAVTDPASYQNLDIDGWAQESYDIAITKYDNIVPNVALPQWYIDENVPVCQQRVTLGGYRLAYLIEYMWPSSTESKNFLQ